MNSGHTEFSHIPVLAEQTVSLLTEGRTSGRFRMIDCTLGRGGHSARVLRQNPEARLLGLDRDPEAIARSRENLAFAADRITLVQSDFAHLSQVAEQAGWDGADAILMDLGVSSPQIDDPKRGFSFRSNGPLDMRMDTGTERTAARVLNTYDGKALERIFREYGELREARFLARAVVEKREEKPFETTFQFAEVCDKVLKRSARRGAPPAPTLCFQALRIEVNDELGQLQSALEAATELLNPGGVLAVISFHSLEDRIVKRFMNDMAMKCKCPPGCPVCICNWHPKLEILTRKPVTAEKDELRANPRAACAKLRGARKLQ
ncbi:MAG: Ribosomal RNA small subunit methyltransferase H [Lentisphaerae bacterium ADurb.Bin242]|nr:MAG: Ribosomal RNA small subunit methyltransferase H [Lentisphaerae bacterium ADurb.Bin242]